MTRTINLYNKEVMKTEFNGGNFWSLWQTLPWLISEIIFCLRFEDYFIRTWEENNRVSKL